MTGSVLRIARNDFLNVRRSRLLWGVIGAYGLFVALLVVSSTTTEITSATQLLVGVTGITAVVLPVIAIVAGYLALAGERESGTITVRLGLPDSRLAVLLGKLLSRGATVLLGLAVAFGLALLIAVGVFGSVDPAVYARFVAVSTLFALVNAAIAVGLSALAATRARAMTLAGGFYVAGNLLWLLAEGVLVGALRSAAGLVGLGLPDRGAAVITALTPMDAYLSAMELVFAPGAAGPVAWVGVASLLAWGIAVPAVGYWRFRGAELA